MITEHQHSCRASRQTSGESGGSEKYHDSGDSFILGDSGNSEESLGVDDSGQSDGSDNFGASGDSCDAGSSVECGETCYSGDSGVIGSDGNGDSGISGYSVAATTSLRTLLFGITTTMASGSSTQISTILTM